MSHDCTELKYAHRSPVDCQQVCRNPCRGLGLSGGWIGLCGEEDRQRLPKERKSNAELRFKTHAYRTCHFTTIFLSIAFSASHPCCSTRRLASNAFVIHSLSRLTTGSSYPLPQCCATSLGGPINSNVLITAARAATCRTPPLMIRFRYLL